MTVGSRMEISSFLQVRSPRKPKPSFIKKAYCKRMLVEFENQFLKKLDEPLEDELDEPEETLKNQQNTA